MAKSDSFFIRGKVSTNGTTYTQNEIDLGSFVNLGVAKSTLLRIHNISVQVAGKSLITQTISDGSAFAMLHQLTTQSQSEMVYATDKSLVASGSLRAYNAPTSEDGSAAADYTTGFITQHFDVAPQDFTNGYLVGVDSLFLGCDLSSAVTDMSICYVMECTLENATQANSVALALSQQ
ncbi:MAG: hypothetical protein [Circular genetic element sp.]|jgi:hypothetical protein|nr:MAG: hypothetical protein [Circular genetic element sp.]